MRCKRCGYDLRTLDEHRCPECGRGFDPRRPGTYLSEPVSGKRNLWWAIAAAAMFVIPPALGLTKALDVYFQYQSPTALHIAVVLFVGPGLMITGAAIATFVCWTSGMVLLGHRPWVTDRKAFYASLPISLAIVAYFYGRVPFAIIHACVDAYL